MKEELKDIIKDLGHIATSLYIVISDEESSEVALRVEGARILERIEQIARRLKAIKDEK